LRDDFWFSAAVVGLLFQLCPTPLESSTFGTLLVADRKMRGTATDITIVAGHFWGPVTSFLDRHQQCSELTVARVCAARAPRVRHVWQRLPGVENGTSQLVANPFIVQRHGPFVAKHKLHPCPEYVAGGDLAHQMAKRGAIPLHEARLYVAEVAIAHRELHSKSQMASEMGKGA
jgi:hypothetical protein